MESLLEKKIGAGKTRSLHGKNRIFTLHPTQKLTQMLSWITDLNMKLQYF